MLNRWNYLAKKIDDENFGFLKGKSIKKVDDETFEDVVNLMIASLKYSETSYKILKMEKDENNE